MGTKTAESGLSGVVLLDKPKGISSAKATARLRRCYGGAKGGHGGSLDPLASGALPVYLGYATRFAGHALAAGKSYTAVVRLGLATDTDDMEGRVISRSDSPAPSLAMLRQALASQRGLIEQTPPRYSAVKIRGAPAYRLARQGLSPAMQTRRVHIERLELIDYSYPRLRLEVDCSKGTYIRSLARDLGKALGLGGAIEELRRTKVDGFEGVPMHCLEDLESAWQRGESLEDCLMEADSGLGHLPHAVLKETQILDLFNGLAISLEPAQAPNAGDLEEAPEAPWRVYDERKRFLGLAKNLEDGQAKAARLIPRQFALEGGAGVL